MKVLVTGAASPRGRQISAHLAERGHEVVGIDTERWEHPPDDVTVHQLDHRKRGFEELLRHGKLDVIVHLAVHAGFRMSRSERHRLNLEGTSKLIELAAEHDVERLVVASHIAIYGALADNPLFMREDRPPGVGRTFPEMQDVVTTDLLASSTMWRHPALRVVVLRLVHAMGPTSRGALASLIRRPWVPTVLGYDPMLQVIHEDDVANAFALAVEQDLRGVYNVTGPGEVPLSVILGEVGARNLPVPERALRAIRGRLGLAHVGRGVIEFLKHPCLADGQRFREATGFAPAHDLRATLQSQRLAH